MPMKYTLLSYTGKTFLSHIHKFDYSWCLYAFVYCTCVSAYVWVYQKSLKSRDLIYLKFVVMEILKLNSASNNENSYDTE